MKTASLLFLLILLGCLAPSPTLLAQVFRRTAIAGYDVDNGLLGKTVSNMVTDQFGFVWFSSLAGIQRFDGSHFETVRISGQDPVAFVPASLSLVNGEVWISHHKGISAFDPATNRMRSVYSRPTSLVNYGYQFAAEDSTTAWFLSYKDALIRLNKKTGALVDSVSLPAELESMGFGLECQSMGPDWIVIRLNQSLAVFSTTTKKFICYRSFRHRINGLTPLNAHSLVYAVQARYYLLDPLTGRDRLIGEAEGIQDRSSYIHFVHTREGKLLTAYEKNVYELDTTGFRTRTKWGALNQDHLINSGYISNIYLDSFDRLWIMTNSDGVKKMSVSPQPFRYFGTASREANFIRSVYASREEGIILAGTYENGLLVFDTLGNLLRQVPSINGEVKSVISIVHLEGSDYLLATMGGQTFYRFNSKTLKAHPLTYRGRKLSSCSYYGDLIRAADGSFVFSDYQVIRFRIRQGVLADTVQLRPPAPFLYNLAARPSGGYYISSEKGLELTDTAFRAVRFTPFDPPISVRCMALDAKGQVWLGTETGLYQVSPEGKITGKYTGANGLANEDIYSIQAVADGIYFGHNKGLSFLAQDGRLIHYNRYSGLQENEFNTKSTFRATNGELFFGGINGISAFHPSDLSRETRRPQVYITGLRIMDRPLRDTAAWSLRELELPYDANRIALRLGVPGAADNTGYVYEYQVEGLSPDWIATSATDFIHFVLPPGIYTFRARIRDRKSALGSETQLRIVVEAPFWEQTWFLLLAVLAGMGLLIFSIHRYHRSRYRRQLEQLELERRLQRERERISRDLHDNLGAYASAIAENVDRIGKERDDEARWQSLKANAAEIMSNLRDSIWALNKERITVQTLGDRLRAYLQKMREAYPHIQITLNDSSVAQHSLSPELALNLLRIIQEAFHNAVRHSGATRIEIRVEIGEQVCISVEDNGQGIDPGARGGTGLNHMRERARESGLDLRIASGVGGTTVELKSQSQ